MDKKYVEEMARRIRCDIIGSLCEAGSGHPGGSLSLADILAVLYFDTMRIDPQQPQWPDRDRFVLSKGHAAPALYAALAERGYFPKEELHHLRELGAMLQGHPDRKSTPGVDMSTGSLGQGLSAANGMALAGCLDGRDYQVYVVLGDGECQEGQVWEAAMSAAHYHLGRVTAILDHNGLQIDGRNDEVMGLGDVAANFRAFGWDVLQTDGHDVESLWAALELARANQEQPTMIIVETIKGKGVSFMENEVGWHGKAPTKEQAAEALKELGGDAGWQE